MNEDICGRRWRETLGCRSNVKGIQCEKLSDAPQNGKVGDFEFSDSVIRVESF